MSIDRDRLKIHEERLRIYERDKGVCQACGKLVRINEFEVAHRIANTKLNIRRWGKDIVDHPMNKATTHRGRCNSAMNIGFRPNECQDLVAKIHGQTGQDKVD